MAYDSIFYAGPGMPADPPKPERRNVAGSETWITTPSIAGVIVTEQTAVTFGAVYGCINVLCSDVSVIPFLVVRRESSGSRVIDWSNPINQLVYHTPNENISAMGWFSAQEWHLNTHGNAYSKIYRDRNLNPREIVLLDPLKVETKRNDEGKVYYKAGEEIILAEDMIHVANVTADGVVGKSPIRLCMETIGVGMAAEKFGAAYFGNGINAKGIFKTPTSLDQVERDQLRKEIDDQHRGPYNASRPLLLSGGLEFTPTTIPADEAQFIETRKFQKEEICMIFRVPLSKLQSVEKGSFGYLEEVNLEYYDSSIKPWARRFEVELTRKLFSRDERRFFSIEHDTSRLQMGRILDQANADKIYREMGVNNADEIRAMRNRGGPISEGGKTYFVPLNMAPLDKVASASLETLKGVKPVAEGIASGTSNEINEPVATTDARLLRSLDAVVIDAGKRMARREANALRSIAKNPEITSIVAGLEKFYSTEARTLAEAFGPSVRAYRTAAGLPPLDAQLLADELVAESRARLLTLISQPDTARSLSDLASDWETTKPEALLERVQKGTPDATH